MIEWRRRRRKLESRKKKQKMPSAETSNPAVTGNGGDTVLNSISVNDVKKVAILGSAGCGKSSLIHR